MLYSSISSYSEFLPDFLIIGEGRREDCSPICALFLSRHIPQLLSYAEESDGDILC